MVLQVVNYKTLKKYKWDCTVSNRRKLFYGKGLCCFLMKVSWKIEYSMQPLTLNVNNNLTLVIFSHQHYDVCLPFYLSPTLN